MKILENELLIKYDAEREEIITYRLTDNPSEIILHTAYPLSSMAAKGFHEAGRIIGEDILISFQATREKLIG